ncbi:MAG: hypothetical protein M3405_14400 [Acidobacteriota bacterium]|jgi:hypothetical protein|nr:hypothetical protein [Acidobacteriota bacterium]
MTQQQLIKEFRNYPQSEKSVVIRQLLQIFEEDLSNEELKNGNAQQFRIDAISLEPKRDFDFDNIGKLISEMEGDFHK